MLLDPTTVDAIKVFLPTAVSFFIGIGITPLVTDYLYKNKMWKKSAGKSAPGKETPIFDELHKDKEVGTPKMGGVIIWASVLITTLVFWLASQYGTSDWLDKLNFLGRGQTWLPLFTLVVGSLVGLIDDWFEVTGRVDHLAGGLSLKKRLLVVLGMSIIGAWWFYTKLGISSVFVPFVGSVALGWLFIPFFILVMLSVYSGGVIDGIDGLAGGVFAIMFGAYGVIAFSVSLINLAAFCFVIVGALLAFLWFNIPPARFYMAETGTMGLTTTLAVVAFLTDFVLLLPIIAFPLLATTASDIIQIASKYWRGRKVFRVAPVHHHFEALGWSGAKVTMRYWIISFVAAIIGIVLALLSLT